MCVGVCTMAPFSYLILIHVCVMFSISGMKVMSELERMLCSELVTASKLACTQAVGERTTDAGGASTSEHAQEMDIVAEKLMEDTREVLCMSCVHVT